MSLEDKAERLTSLAETIKGTIVNFNRQFISISKKRRRISRNVIERKERFSKLKIQKSSFGNSLGNIANSIAKTPIDIFSKVLSFASLLLLGSVINAIPNKMNQVDKDLTSLNDKQKGVGGFIVGIVKGLQDFFGSGSKLQKNVNTAFDDLDNEFDNFQSEAGKLEGSLIAAETFDPEKLLNNQSSEQQNNKDFEREDNENVDSKYKRSPKNTTNFNENKKVDKNFVDVNKLLFKREREFVLDPIDLDVTKDEIKFNKDLINKIKKIDPKTIVATEDTVEGEIRTIIIKQKILVD